MAFNKTDRPEGAKMRRPGGMRRKKESLRILRRQEWRN